jgi:hypothetical protein
MNDDASLPKKRHSSKGMLLQFGNLDKPLATKKRPKTGETAVPLTVKAEDEKPEKAEVESEAKFTVKAEGTSEAKSIKLVKTDALKKESHAKVKLEPGGPQGHEDPRKVDLVTRLLCRWWYVLEDWPPKRFDYAERLRSKRLRVVPEETWNVEPFINSQGLEKVKALTNYPGLFQTSRGVVHDMRPQDTCPCFDNLLKKSIKTLKDLLETALEKQLEELEVQPDYNRELSEQLRREVEYLRAGTSKLKVEA